jgi:hypothetical protein
VTVATGDKRSPLRWTQTLRNEEQGYHRESEGTDRHDA